MGIIGGSTLGVWRVASRAFSAAEPPPPTPVEVGDCTYWEETLAPGMSLVGTGRQTLPFEVAGDLSSAGDPGYDSAAWIPSRFTPIAAPDPDENNTGWYRRNVFQGTPPWGRAYSPTVCDMGKGDKETYVRVELRHGAAQVLKSTIDQWKADPKKYRRAGYTDLSRLTQELMPFDEREGDATGGDPSYTRSFNPGKDRTRNRVERVFANKKSAIIDPHDATPHWYEWQIYLEPGWPGQWIAQQAECAVTVLLVKRQSAFFSFYVGRGDADAENGLAKFQWSANGGHAAHQLQRQKTMAMNDIAGKWLHIRLEISFAREGWFTLKLRENNGAMSTIWSQKPADTSDGFNVTNSTHLLYGIYATGAMQVGSDGWYNPDAGRRTVAWYTGVRSGRL
jgi:hypothetical protein